MDLLDIDFNSLLPYVIDAYTFVYGEEYCSVISKKVRNTLILFYNDVEGLNNYLEYLKRCKRREYSIRFLDRIGIDVEKYKKDNYTEPLDDEVNSILDYYISWGFTKYDDDWSPLRAFNPNNHNRPQMLLKNKLKIINYLLGSNHEKITEGNFDSFTQTNEYLELLKKIDELNIIYEELLQEYNAWKSQLLPYKEYVEYENRRKEDILKCKRAEFFREIFSKLPSSVKAAVSNKSFEERQEVILGYSDIASKSRIEKFSLEQIEKLKSSSVSIIQKYLIVSDQVEYLEKLGITIPNEDMLRCKTEEDIYNYLNFLSQDDVRKLIPSDELISYISSIREQKYEEALREYYTTRRDFRKIMKNFSNNPNNLEFVYSQIKNKNVCILGCGGRRGNEFVSIMFYTIRRFDGGELFHVFMHENGHVIDQSEKGCAFEPSCDFGKNFTKNPYDKAYRKYEKFNETLTDIFAIEAVKYLHDQGIYLIEPKEVTSLDTSNRNTAQITKNLLQPLLQRFKSQVIKAKINAEPEELIRYIGEENFEELVDAVNKVDYLSRNGVVPKIDSSKDDEMVLEYFRQVERVKRIYENIDDYYRNNASSLGEEPVKNK